MLCCNDFTTPLNNASTVVPVGENGSWFISSKPLVHDENVNDTVMARRNDEAIQLFFIILSFFIITN